MKIKLGKEDRAVMEEQQRTRREELERLKRLTLEFDGVLRSEKEEPVQQFISSNPPLLSFIHWDGFVVAKHPLGNDYVTDFVMLGREPYSNSPYLVATFIEIESPSMALFTKSGDPSARLTHALRQVQDWKKWVADNRVFVKDEFIKIVQNPGSAKRLANSPDARAGDILNHSASQGVRDRYLAVCGRRNPLSPSDRIRLAEMNENLDNIRIITFDVILEGLLRSIERESRSAWDSIPMVIDPFGYEL